MLKWSWKVIDLPLKFAWSISRGTSLVKRNFIISVGDSEDKEGGFGQGEIAFNIRYGENEQKIEEELQRFKSLCPGQYHDLINFESFLKSLNLSASLRFGLESAYAHYLASKQNISLEKLLKVEPVGFVETSFSLPIMEPSQVASFIKKYNLSRFKSLKIKVNKDLAYDLLDEVIKCYQGPLRIDANESWERPEEVLNFIKRVGPERLEFMEQPMPSDLLEESKELKKYSPCCLMADESITNEEIKGELVDSFHGVNIKLMKSGGYLQALRQLDRARELGLRTMLGCMIETTLGISSAMKIAANVNYLDLDGFLLIENDPFELVQEEKGNLFISKAKHSSY